MEKKEEVKLLDVWASPFGMRVRMALALKGVDYEYSEQDLMTKSELLLRSNPVHKKIPVLLHNGNPICESLIIVQYVDETFSGSDAPLLPTDPIARANARFWTDFVDKKVYECGTRLWKMKGEAQAAAAEEFVGIVRLLETELGDKDFFGGDAVGFVDVALAPFACSWFPAYDEHSGGGLRIEEHCPKIAAWAARFWKMETFAKCLEDPKKISEFICYLKKKYGVE